MDTTHRDLERDIDRIDAMLHADEAPRGRRAAKSGGSEDESGRKGGRRSGREAAAARIEVIDLGEVDGLGIEDKDVLRTLRELATSHSTFAEAYAGCFAGSVYLPEAPGATRKRVHFGFCLDAARLALLDIDGVHSGTAEGALTDDLSSYPSAPRALYELLRHLIREDFLRLVDVEGELSDIEERIIAAPSRLRGEDGRILRRRRELMRMNGAYQQLDELASTIAQDDDGLLPAPIGGCSTRCPSGRGACPRKPSTCANTACSSSSSRTRGLTPAATPRISTSPSWRPSSCPSPPSRGGTA